MNALVGSTGFVGSNLCETGQFDVLYNSKNIEKAYGTKPELLVYAGLRAEKYLVNQAPGKDLEMIIQAERNISMIDPKKLVLISTVDVFRVPKDVDEESVIDTNCLSAYGYNRYQLELWVRNNYPDALIIRLPGLFGKNIKKNFIYDYIHVIPFRLKVEKMEELSLSDKELKMYYSFREDGFYTLNALSIKEKRVLKKRFIDLGFSALNFTDSRSRYQFYNLKRLWEDTQKVLKAGIVLWHPAVEPVSVEELYEYLSGNQFDNRLEGTPFEYDYRTIYDKMFGGKNGYIIDKQDILKEVKEFVESYGE